MDVLDIQIPRALPEHEINFIADLINRIYLDEEEEVWLHDGRYQRCTAHDITSLVKYRSLVVGRSKNEIACVVHLENRKDHYGFNMLVTAEKHRCKGYAKRMIHYIEEVARSKGSSEMEIELLMAQNHKLPRKETMRNWYKALGYRDYSRIPFEQKDPGKAELMRIPCDFLVMRKSLD